MRIFSIFILFFAFPFNVFAVNPAILVKAVRGEAVLTDSTGQRAKVKPGTLIPEGSVLASDYQGSVDVSAHGNAGFRFLPDSKVYFISTAPEKMKLALENGNLIARFKNKIDPNATFEIETPTAILAVRGTQFWGRVESPAKNPVTSFAVRAGVVNVTAKSTGQVYTLKKGQAVDLPQDETQPRFRQAEPAEISAIAQSETIEI